MKKVFLSIFLSLAVSTVFGCWFTTESINCYIAGVNFFQEHISIATINSYKNGINGTVRNGMTTSLPMTLWFFVEPRTSIVNGQKLTYQIRLTRLYYKVIPKNSADDNTTSVWRLAKEIDMGDNPRWNLNFSSNVKLFGNNSLTKDIIRRNGDNIQKGDKIIFVWYLADDSVQSITNGPEITVGSNLPRFTVNDNDTMKTTYGGNSVTSDYTAPYVLKVVYNGMTTPGR